MPWLSRSNSSDSIRPAEKDNICNIKNALPDAKVLLIPAQVDGLAGTSPSQYRQVPTSSLLMDTRVLIRSLDSLPKMAMACRPRMWNYMGNMENLWEITVQILLAIMEMAMLAIMAPAFLLLPGTGFALMMLSFWGAVTILSSGFNAERIIISDAMMVSEEFMDEKWLFVNGIMTSTCSLKHQCNRLSRIFGRQITGIHLRTHGLILDLLSSILQRTLPYTTPTSATLYTQTRDALLTPSIHKVILLSHNTGSITTSQVLDRLHADLPVDVLQKLEIYTFGSAAGHLSNPCKLLDSPFNNNGNTVITRNDGSVALPVKAALSSRGRRIEDTEKVIPHIEHYASSNDIFARWGILHNVKSVLDNRFSGRLFVLQDLKIDQGAGFLFQDHYLNALFPLSSTTPNMVHLLNHVVDVDISTAEKREFTAQGVAMPANSMRSGSPGQSPKLSKEERRASWGSGGFGFDAVDQARGSARECEGLSVRQLSRLWRYAGGCKPVGEGVGIVNDVGHMGNGSAR